MPLDASIYQNLRPVEMPSMLDSMGKAANLSSLAMQQAHAAKTMQHEDAEAQAKGRAQRVSAWGNALDGLRGVPQEQRATAYAQMREQLIKDGHAKPDELPPQEDMGLTANMDARWQQTPEYLKKQHTIAEIRKLNAEAKRKDHDPNLAWREEQRQAARQKQLDAGVGKLQDNLGNTQDAVRSIKDVEGTLGFQLEDYSPNKDDLPGVSVPGLGRFTAFSAGARNLNSSMAKIFNTVLKDRSGSAVTTPELERLRDEFNSGKYNSESELIAAAKRYKAGIQAKMQDIEAGANPAAVAEYRDRRGTTSQELSYRAGQRKEAPGGGGMGPNEAYAGTIKPPPAGMILMESPNGKKKYVSQADKAEAIASGGKVVK